MNWKTQIFMLILLIPIAKAQVIINEIMADPIADEDLNEWVELYNNGTETINMSNWKIGDNNDNDTLSGGFYNGQGTLIPAGGYAIITDSETRVYNNFNCTHQTTKLYVDDTSIGSGLNNGGKTLYLYNSSGDLVDTATYNATTEGKSWLLSNGSWWKGNTSCGYENYAELPQECDYTINAITNQTIYEDGNNFSFTISAQNIYGEKTNITITKQITNIYGDIVKDYANITDEITTHKTYTYTPNLDPGSYVLTTTITTNCTDTNTANNQDSEIFLVQDKPRSNQSYVLIDTIYDLGTDGKAKFGQTIRAKVNIYKANTTKYSISMWMQDSYGNRISKESKTNTETEYTNYTLTLPLQINPNCDNNNPDTEYTLVLEGLDSQDTKTIPVEGITEELCKKIYTQKSSNTAALATPTGFSYELIYMPEKIKVGEKFSSKLKISNNDEENTTVEVWSYVYRGNKAYSGDREQNKAEYFMKPKTTKTIDLTNKVTEAEPGLYNYKIKIVKNKQKTSHDITKDLIIEPSDDIDAKITSTNANITKDATNLTIKIKNYGKEIKDLQVMTDTLLENKTTLIDLKKNEEKQITLKIKTEKTKDAAFVILYKDKILDYKKTEINTPITQTKEEIQTQTLSGIQSKQEEQNTITGMAILSKTPKIVYESTTIKAKNTVLLGTTLLLTITLMFIIWKKEL